MPYTKPGKQKLYHALLKKAVAWSLDYLNSMNAWIELRAGADKYAPDNLNGEDLDSVTAKALRVARGRVRKEA